MFGTKVSWKKQSKYESTCAGFEDTHVPPARSLRHSFNCAPPEITDEKEIMKTLLIIYETSKLYNKTDRPSLQILSWFASGGGYQSVHWHGDNNFDIMLGQMSARETAVARGNLNTNKCAVCDVVWWDFDPDPRVMLSWWAVRAAAGEGRLVCVFLPGQLKPFFPVLLLDFGGLI